MYHMSNSTRRFIEIDRGSLTPEAVDLGPAGQARFDVMSETHSFQLGYRTLNSNAIG